MILKEWKFIKGAAAAAIYGSRANNWWCADIY
jgi:hypothetical protein